MIAENEQRSFLPVPVAHSVQITGAQIPDEDQATGLLNDENKVMDRSCGDIPQLAQHPRGI